MSNIIQQLEAEQMTREVPAFYPGDTVTVQVRVKEGERERLQAFEGVVIADYTLHLRYVKYLMAKVLNVSFRPTVMP